MRTTLLTMAILAAGTSIPALSMATDVTVKAGASIEAPITRRTADRTFDVKVRGKRDESRSEVYDEALYEAARKTRKKDYDWFRIVESEIDSDTRRTDNESGFEAGYERVPYKSCGLLTCRTEYRTERRTSVSIDFDDREETRYTVKLEFEAGWGSMPIDGETYDARRVERDYR
ncbi:hypothetical protein GCM10009069_00270 [Algimonas arctica]|uniref:Uncharacterized protein n=1 Tax=Algimonas arctica TaxID=1479486 RepID=A0A8J3G0Q2_9PROT|nr:hypothetical protein [Algimonas arctica]GHA81264.1 hypothetical protein GCM10009069_00270 [Algimonas arctica]